MAMALDWEIALAAFHRSQSSEHRGGVRKRHGCRPMILSCEDSSEAPGGNKRSLSTQKQREDARSLLKSAVGRTRPVASVRET